MTFFSKTYRLMWAAGAAAILCGAVPAEAQRISEWLTTSDKAHLLEQQAPISWHAGASPQESIVVDDAKTYQTMDGFGHTLTGGTAQLMMKMTAPARTKLLHELFQSAPQGIGTSYLRVTVGASDMNDHVYTYDDLPNGQQDTALAHFTLAEDEKDVIPVLREILAIKPDLKIMASPWTAPAWMKENGAVKGGSLKRQDYETYAQYLVLYLKGMQARGIRIDALTPQNEPENPKNTPSMVMTAPEEAEFIGKHLGPAIAAAGLRTKIIAFDHNCDHPIYPETVLRDPDAARYTDGSGFHLYMGDIDTLSEVHDAFPNKNIYFTEQMVVARGDTFPIAMPVARLILGAPANWSRNVLLWNLAADPQNGPHTADGGCPMCSGAITLEGDHVTRLIAYYTVAHASKFVPAGSVRIGSAAASEMPSNIAFRTPEGKRVLIVSNTSSADREFAIAYRGKQADVHLAAGAVATYVW